MLSTWADLDLSGIHTTTTADFGITQADRYIQFLVSEMELIASMPGIGRRIAERPGRQNYIAKWPGAKAGHRIVYEVTEDSIYVVRILHTAMQYFLYIQD